MVIAYSCANEHYFRRSSVVQSFVKGIIYMISKRMNYNDDWDHNILFNINKHQHICVPL